MEICLNSNQSQSIKLKRINLRKNYNKNLLKLIFTYLKFKSAAKFNNFFYNLAKLAFGSFLILKALKFLLFVFKVEGEDIYYNYDEILAKHFLEVNAVHLKELKKFIIKSFDIKTIKLTKDNYNYWIYHPLKKVIFDVIHFKNISSALNNTNNNSNNNLDNNFEEKELKKDFNKTTLSKVSEALSLDFINSIDYIITEANSSIIKDLIKFNVKKIKIHVFVLANFMFSEILEYSEFNPNHLNEIRFINKVDFSLHSKLKDLKKLFNLNLKSIKTIYLEKPLIQLNSLLSFKEENVNQKIKLINLSLFEIYNINSFLNLNKMLSSNNKDKKEDSNHDFEAICSILLYITKTIVTQEVVLALLYSSSFQLKTVNLSNLKELEFYKVSLDDMINFSKKLNLIEVKTLKVTNLSEYYNEYLIKLIPLFPKLKLFYFNKILNIGNVVRTIYKQRTISSDSFVLGYFDYSSLIDIIKNLKDNYFEINCEETLHTNSKIKNLSFKDLILYITKLKIDLPDDFKFNGNLKFLNLNELECILYNLDEIAPLLIFNDLYLNLKIFKFYKIVSSDNINLLFNLKKIEFRDENDIFIDYFKENYFQFINLKYLNITHPFYDINKVKTFLTETLVKDNFKNLKMYCFKIKIDLKNLFEQQELNNKVLNYMKITFKN